VTESFAETCFTFVKRWGIIILFEGFLAYVTISMWRSGSLTRELFLALAAIAISVFIAYRQEIQLIKITSIGIQTNDLTLKQQSDLGIKANIDSFFSFNRVIHSGKKFKIVFPVYDQQKPLPLLNQGDFYAIHIITSRLLDKSVDLIQVSDSVSKEKLPKIDDANPIIYICAPQANKALNELYHFKEIRNDSDYEKLKNENWPMAELNLPCWFIEDYRDKSGQERSIYIIDESVPGSDPVLKKSPAENLYKEAKKNKSSAKNHDEEAKMEKTGFKHPTIIEDYAIFGRITRDNETKSQCFILAGIHQYGTWIVAQLLRNIINKTKEDLEFSSVYLSNNDFIAVIEGKFNFEKLDIADNDIKVQFNHFWVKKEGVWKKADSQGKIIN
jgi:hypothetical protein